MADVIKGKYERKAVIYDNIWMYFISTAKEVVSECRKSQKRITGLEAFRITGEGIQPSQEHSVSFRENDDTWTKAIEFLSFVSDTEYLYEIWYDGY